MKKTFLATAVVLAALFFVSCTKNASLAISNGILTKCDRNAKGTVKIPKSVTEIADEAFKECISMESVSIPKSVTSIGDKAFTRCNSLTSVTIPASVTSIGDCVFEACENLRSVTLSEGITSTGAGTFQFCKSLTSVTIPASVTSIGNWAFGGCTRLATVNYGGTKAQWAAIEKANSWHYKVLATKVTCSDGEVNLDYTGE